MGWTEAISSFLLSKPELWGNSSETNWAPKVTSSLEGVIQLCGIVRERAEGTAAVIKTDRSEEAELVPIELLTGNPSSISKGHTHRH